MTQNKSSLTDEAIVEIAQKIDQLILEVGEQYHPSGIEFASIALGRLMIFSKQVGCFETFSQLLTTVSKMSEVEPLSKTDLQ
jgi:hypothetical protein